MCSHDGNKERWVKRHTLGPHVGSDVAAALEACPMAKAQVRVGIVLVSLHRSEAQEVEGGQFGNLELETPPNMQLTPQGDPLGRLQATLQLQKV